VAAWRMVVSSRAARLSGARGDMGRHSFFRTLGRILLDGDFVMKSPD
jgi:hypothetical protein